MGSDPQDDAVAETATAWFVRMSSDRVTDRDRRAFRAWIEADPAHRAAYARAEALWDELAHLPDPRAAGRSHDGVGERGAGATAAKRPRRRASARRYAALAACLLLVALSGLWSLGGYDRLRADHATAVGETRRITLSDGSLVHLNTDTAVGLDYTAERRRIRLYRGEAFFAVAADSRRPFEVVTGAGVARAVGTAFNLRSGEAAMTVAVAEGRVQVSREPASGPADDAVVLGAGEALRYAASGRARRLAADVDALTAWRRGKLVFADRPLRSVVAELDRYRPGAIVLLDAKIADERFSGVISLADTDRALAAIESTLGVDVIQVTAYLTLLREKR